VSRGSLPAASISFFYGNELDKSEYKAIVYSLNGTEWKSFDTERQAKEWIYKKLGIKEV
jgi:hypothetical protein